MIADTYAFDVPLSSFVVGLGYSVWQLLRHF